MGKTSLAKAIAFSIEGRYGRVQFTPDLLPSDVIGTSIWNQGASEFEFRPGPIFANVLLADEINRASPRTQSALLEAMAEQQVTVEGYSRQLPQPFMVIATQNPIEHRGTYELPEAQMDRFLMRVSIGYPERTDEISMLNQEGAQAQLASMTPTISLDQLRGMIDHCNQMFVAEQASEYILDIIEATRSHELLDLGASPRAGLGLQRAARVSAAIAGRNYVTPDDIKAMAKLVLPHRLILSRRAKTESLTGPAVLDAILPTIALR